MKTSEIREKFLNFFKERGHTIVPSDSLVPSSDPTLLFTSAGMVQFKKHFLGQTCLTFKRAASCQRCLRTSDIERVGHTARHLTFFEMLGNFSFGDYFKKDAIVWGWEFLTKDCKIKAERIYASVYKDDEEAYGLWKKILPESRIVSMGEESNFWNMGPTGPCGPCSELLVDQGESFSKDHSCPGPGCDCDRYLEVWNLVFTQFDRTEDGKLLPLPQKNIDTGMGLERLSSIVNGKESPFQTDMFQNLFNEIKKILPANPDTPHLNPPPQGGRKDEISEYSLRVISDHIRAVSFLISDGILPSNEGRGYILRRILRRALREGWKRGIKDPFLHKLVPVIVNDSTTMNIQSVIQQEEKNALETIEIGTKTLEEEIKKTVGKTSGKIQLPGEKVFSIYETYGLDKEIQKEIVKDWGGELTFSESEYVAAKESAAQEARKGWKGSGKKDATAYFQLQKKINPSVFKGYELLRTDTTVQALFKDQVEVPSLSEGDEGEAFLSDTPFYSESGGQVGDAGTLERGTELKVEVLDTQKPLEGIISHRVKVIKGKLRSGDKVEAHVNEVLRKHTMRHHTATHLLHAALRKILGKGVTQAGSLVSPEKLRFDFTFPRALTEEEMESAEKEVNAQIRMNIPRKRGEQALSEAREGGALAFFGEKYGERVFVVNYGQASTEVCGGTHCQATGDIGYFVITGESSVGSGVRRIEALAGEKAESYMRGQEKFLHAISQKLKCTPEEAAEKIDKILERGRNSAKQSLPAMKEGGTEGLKRLLPKAKVFPAGERGNGKIKVLAQEIDSPDLESFRQAADFVRDSLGSAVVVLARSEDDKISFVVTLSKDCIQAGLNAGKIAKHLAAKLGGSGGGKEAFAQGGGKKTSELNKILESLPDEIMKEVIK